MYHMIRRAMVAILLCGMLLTAPSAAWAYPFGGRISMWWPCFFEFGNISLIGPPNSGLYIWTLATKTYKNGAPSHPGQWILGQTGIPFFCTVMPVGPIIIPGMAISMMGSSQ